MCGAGAPTQRKQPLCAWWGLLPLPILSRFAGATPKGTTEPAPMLCALVSLPLPCMPQAVCVRCGQEDGT